MNIEKIEKEQDYYLLKNVLDGTVVFMKGDSKNVYMVIDSRHVSKNEFNIPVLNLDSGKISFFHANQMVKIEMDCKLVINRN